MEQTRSELRIPFGMSDHLHGSAWTGAITVAPGPIILDAERLPHVHDQQLPHLFPEHVDRPFQRHQTTRRVNGTNTAGGDKRKDFIVVIADAGEVIPTVEST